VYRNKLKSLLLKTEKDYYCCKFKYFQGNLRKTWQLLREVMHNGKNMNIVNNFIADDGSTISNPQEVVDHFNDYFVNISNSPAATIPTSSTQHVFHSDRTFINSFTFHPTDAYEIVQIANGLQDKNSFGIDCIRTNIMKLTIAHLSVVISALVNCFFRTGYFPNELKIAKVCPIFKGGAHNIFQTTDPYLYFLVFQRYLKKLLTIEFRVM